MFSAKNSIKFLNKKKIRWKIWSYFVNMNKYIFYECIKGLDRSWLSDWYRTFIHSTNQFAGLINMNICPKFQLSDTLLFIPRRYGPSSQCCSNRAISLFLCYFFHHFLCKLFLPPQVFEERSVPQGRGDLPLRHRHWPLRESHRSPGQHCCIST